VCSYETAGNTTPVTKLINPQNPEFSTNTNISTYCAIIKGCNNILHKESKGMLTQQIYR
jgi:hypothetical protein